METAHSRAGTIESIGRNQGPLFAGPMRQIWPEVTLVTLNAGDVGGLFGIDPSWWPCERGREPESTEC